MMRSSSRSRVRCREEGGLKMYVSIQMRTNSSSGGRGGDKNKCCSECPDFFSFLEIPWQFWNWKIFVCGAHPQPTN